ncbi:GDSL esterase/lipase At5g33370-like isoform X1 [Nicotiana tabacum]|uniref:GDSL esterase/lipase At5g33370-like n=1 Tax=Nicotiana tabacum TaxID=4097 RepID=A0A1S4A2M4_TOBAC|nr:GDSL esterase/lipase At5g33370-like [Nicotiana tomentosiformis]XP_016470821.1 PREDICTED: GDSL esterase/lipase At5g33370-like [Nicotiana tabacum]
MAKLGDLLLHRFKILLLSVVIWSTKLVMADVPAIFIFGDSTVDVGTNNYVNGSLATANNPYYGIDYPHHIATGRFSNGYNPADIIATHLGNYTESPPAFYALVEKTSTTFKSSILRGVNFASGGSGILDDTGTPGFHHVVSLTQQIEQFQSVCGNITEIYGDDDIASKLLANAFYLISVGSNDFFDQFRYNYNISAPELITYLSDTFANHLQNLYDLGARKFGIVSIPTIGCCPAIRSVTPGGACNETLNDFAQSFYNTTLSLLQEFSSTNPGVKFSLGNSYLMTKGVIDNAVASGFEEVESACCGTGPSKGSSKCTPKSDLCEKRDKYLFWDWFHPTQKASEMAALSLLYATGQEFVTPLNFSTLASIQL